MNIHGVESDSMTNGDGLRVVLWVSGCSHRCEGCHNPQTWDLRSGRKMTWYDLRTIYNELEKDHISGITFSGGDPLHPTNAFAILTIICEIRDRYPSKTIWLYTGYLWEEVSKKYQEIMKRIDVLVDGEFEQDKASVPYEWAGSTNQRVIDVQKSLKERKVCLYVHDKEEI